VVPTSSLGMETSIAVQVLGDVVNCLRGEWRRGGIGVIIAGALLLFLLRPTIRATFT
jgi:hypothetical protein